MDTQTIPQNKPTRPTHNTPSLRETPAPRALNRGDYKTLALSSLGGMLEFYDFVIFIFFAGVLTHLFFPTDSAFMAQMKTLGIFAAGYLARPLGGIVMAHFGDIIGRKKMFSLSIFLMALPTLIIGILPTYAQVGILAPLLLLLMRILQGAALGGEMPGSWVFIAEHVPAQRYGLGMGILTSGITGGNLLGSLVAIGVQNLDLPDSYAWRIPFILGGVFGLITVYLRSYLKETPIFKEIQANKMLSKEMPIKAVLKKYKKACLITVGLTCASSTAVVVPILMTPSIVLEHLYGIPRALSLEANCVATLTITLGCIFWGCMEDALKTRLNSLIAWGGLIIVAFYFYATLSPTIDLDRLIINYAALGFFAGAIAITPIVSTRAFPSVVRYSGLSFSYNISYAIFGGLTPMLMGAFLQKSVLAPAYYIAATALLAILISLVPLAYRGYKEARIEEAAAA